jgi:hypothetical protein
MPQRQRAISVEVFLRLRTFCVPNFHIRKSLTVHTKLVAGAELDLTALN